MKTDIEELKRMAAEVERVTKQRDELQEAVKAYFVARDEVDRLTKTVTAWTRAKVGTPGEIIRAATVMHETRAKINALLGIKAED